MNQISIDRRIQTPGPMGFRTVVLVCLVLLALFTAAQLTHLHLAQTDADHCALCIAMHSAAPVAVAALVVVLVRFEHLAPAAERIPIRLRRRLRLTSRPPPAGC